MNSIKKIDYIEDLDAELSSAEQIAHKNYGVYTKCGLEFLSRCVSDANCRTDVKNLQQATSSEELIIIHYYDWFSVTATSWVMFCGKILKQKPGDYCDRVIPAVRKWRNKRGAHLSYTDAKGDNEAMQTLSLTAPQSFTDGKWQVGGKCTALDSEGNEAEEELPSWEINHIYQGLVSRYWPHR